MTTHFVLKTSTTAHAGLGVFTTTDIPKETYLEVKPRNTIVGVIRKKEEIPAEFISYCIAKEADAYLCPVDFNNMELVWYLNHSTTPNAQLRPDGYYSLKTIAAGEEILIDYRRFNEPADKREAFYSK